LAIRGNNGGNNGITATYRVVFFPKSILYYPVIPERLRSCLPKEIWVSLLDLIPELTRLADMA
jgi:hypothetical protein